MYSKKTFHKKKTCTQQNFTFAEKQNLQKLHSEKYLRCRFAHFVHDSFLHICTFAHLRFEHLQKSFRRVKMFLRSLHTCEKVLRTCANMQKWFLSIFHRICKFERFLQK